MMSPGFPPEFIDMERVGGISRRVLFKKDIE